MGIILANRDAPSRCTATDCLVEIWFTVYVVYAGM